jgi:hypothetical protein
MVGMTLDELLAICQRYSMLGGAVQEQLNAVSDGDPMEDQNPNALVLAADWLRMVRQIAEDDLALDVTDLLAELEAAVRA